MSSHTYAAPLSLQPEVSHRLGAALVILHAGALLAPFVVPLPASARAVLLAAVGASLIHAWRMHLGARRITTAVWFMGDDWLLTSGDGTSARACLAPQAYVSPYAVVLRFCSAGRRVRTLVLLPDSLDADVFRRLRVRLRITVTAAAQPPPVRG